MSEYQYYEFRALDRPLTPEQMSEIRALSSRAAITPLRFSNTYNYSDFRGDPRKLMESHYDAHVYVSNFGTVTLMLRLPRTALSDETLAKYATDEGLKWWATAEHAILEWQRDDDPFDDWMDGEGWMDRLLPLRDELVRGDYRSLYIGWLASIAGASLEDEEAEEAGEEYTDEPEGDDVEDADDEEDEDDGEEMDYGGSARRREPPVPVGLRSLTAAQSALTEFLGLDSDLLAAAAEASPQAPALVESSQKAVAWVAQLPEKEVRTIVERILNGEALRVQTELQSRYSRSRSEAQGNLRTKGSRTAAELLAVAARAEQERKRQESEKKKRARDAQLSALVPRFATLWTRIDASAEEQKSASYDQACTLLIDMRDAYDHAGRRPEFDAEFVRFLEKYSRRTALVRKLKEAGLTY